MAKEFESVDIWVGSFPSEERLTKYVEETYSEKDDNAPISQFAADMAQSFYDHDFMERGFLPKATANFRTLIGRHSFSASYFDAAHAAFNKLGPREVDTCVMMWGNEIKNPKSIKKKAYSLYYIGRFSCDPDSPALDK
jgi:hypothetical protein